MFIGSNIHIGTLCLRGVAVAGASYLLDTYPAFAAYSTRLLSGSYAGSCMRVRRASDNAEADIGFADGWVDESAIATHCGASNGYVVTWYDQSGNGYDATQATTTQQFQIYNGSAVLKLNGKPAFYRESDYTRNLQTGTIATQSHPDTIFTVAQVSGVLNYICDGPSVAQRRAIWSSFGGGNMNITANTTVSGGGDQTGAQKVFTALFNTTSSIGRVNGTQIISGDSGSAACTTLTIGNSYAKTNSCDYIQEYVFYSDDQTANFSAIESDINTAFSVY